jgi:hypothetical protein
MRLRSVFHWASDKMYSESGAAIGVGPYKGAMRDHARIMTGSRDQVADHVRRSTWASGCRIRLGVAGGRRQEAGPKSESCRDFSTASGTPPMRSITPPEPGEGLAP